MIDGKKHHALTAYYQRETRLGVPAVFMPALKADPPTVYIGVITQSGPTENPLIDIERH